MKKDPIAVKTIKRLQLIPKECSRCGSDLLTGSATLILPHMKKYICFCRVCSTGLGINHHFDAKSVTNGDWERFWGEELLVET